MFWLERVYFTVSSGSSSRSRLEVADISSNKIRTAGAISSSYCPSFTLQIKAKRNRDATEMLATNNRIMTLISIV